jgi:hypothetical protein
MDDRVGMIRRSAATTGCLLALLAAVVAFALPLARAVGNGASAWRVYRDGAAEVRAEVPPGWEAISRPITGVLYPPQVFAAASYDARPPRAPQGCTPTKMLRERPMSGVLVEIFEYTPTDPVGKPAPVPSFPPRPARLGYSDATFGAFECAGASYKFVFSASGRAFQAHVWLNRAKVDPRLRSQALRILERFQPTRGRSGRLHDWPSCARDGSKLPDRCALLAARNAMASSPAR